MKQNETNFSPKVAKNHRCELCDYNTCKPSDFKKHLETIKHKMKHNETFETELHQKVAKNLQCSCGISFNNRTTLWRHKKKCNIEEQNYIQQNNSSFNFITPELIMELIKSNQEMKQIILEQNTTILEQNSTINNLVKTGVNNNNINTNSLNNNNNKTFNLQFFLNETCKNAMNITDFVDTIKLQLSDLEKIGEVGYVEGISNIITSNLKAMDVTVRPVHCTDKKRETMYIKDENEWIKEDNNKNKLRKMINNIADKNYRLLPQFREKNPSYKDYSSNISGKYDKMVVEATGGVGGNNSEKEDKIIHNISKCTTIEKYMDVK